MKMIIYTFQRTFFQKSNMTRMTRMTRGMRMTEMKKTNGRRNPLRHFPMTVVGHEGRSSKCGHQAKSLSSDDEDIGGHHNRFNCLLVGGLKYKEQGLVGQPGLLLCSGWMEATGNQARSRNLIATIQAPSPSQPPISGHGVRWRSGTY